MVGAGEVQDRGLAGLGLGDLRLHRHLVGGRWLLLGLLVLPVGAHDRNLLSLLAGRGGLGVGLQQVQGLPVLL